MVLFFFTNYSRYVLMKKTIKFSLDLVVLLTSMKGRPKDSSVPKEQ